MSHERILIVEDEPTLARALSAVLEHLGYTTEVVNNGEDALRKQAEWDCDLVFLDYVLPGMDGLAALTALKEVDPELPVLFMTSRGSIDNAVAAMKAGASDYIVKPLDLEATALKVRNVLEMASLRREVAAMKDEIRAQHGFEHIAARSERMREILDTVRTVAQSEADTVLLLGDSGVGKNLFAKAIHYNSSRASRPFTNITCTALPDSLMESELFGHEKGAFTDAKKGRKGLFESSDGGTVFLDEIGDMPLGLQAKLLGFLESRRFRRVGGSQELHSDVRIIAATNKDLKEEVLAKRFRGDLYYRLNVIDIFLPPLRDRREDIPQIAELILVEFNRKFRKQIRGIDPAAMARLQAFDWPGNVRELRNILERAVILTRREVLTINDFPADIMGPTKHAPTPRPEPEPEPEPAPAPPQPSPAQPEPPLEAAPSTGGIDTLLSPGFNLERHELDLVKRALDLAEGNQSKAATLLGITRNQMVYRLKKLEELTDR